MVVEIFGNFALCEPFLKVVVDSRQFGIRGATLVDRPTQLICISDIYVNRQIQKT